MTYDQIYENIDKGLYDPPKRDFRADLAQYANAQNIHNFEAIRFLIDFAWKEGHSSGYEDVLSYFDELLPILGIACVHTCDSEDEMVNAGS